jgi:hypothetical protein|eukprot:COSAG06_NODE_2815_length_6235_cov_641.255704_6_plen_64_part_00
MAFSGGMGADLTKKQADNHREEDAYVSPPSPAGCLVWHPSPPQPRRVRCRRGAATGELWPIGM